MARPRYTLSPRAPSNAFRPGESIVKVLIPAHDEEAVIAASLDSVLAQTRPVDGVLLIADNCTDGTVEIARAKGAQILETVGNEHKKAGALNAALAQILPTLDDHDAILIIDADSVLATDFLQQALEELGKSGTGGVGGVFTGRDGGGIVGMFQRNEYVRYARDVERLRGKVLVLTGTATVFSVGALKDVLEARRNGVLPGGDEVYDTTALTEDSELTLALLHLGYRILAPRSCRLTTEVMESWRALFAQRLRWKRGAIENLRLYGWTRVTWRYWGRQALSALGLLATAAYLSSLVFSLAVTHSMHLYPIWMAVSGIFVFERIVTVRARGPLMMALASILVVETLFDGFLQIVHAKAIWDTIVNAERNW